MGDLYRFHVNLPGCFFWKDVSRHLRVLAKMIPRGDGDKCLNAQEKLFYAQIWEEAKAWFDCFFETPETAISGEGVLIRAIALYSIV